MNPTAKAARRMALFAAAICSAFSFCPQMQAAADDLVQIGQVEAGAEQLSILAESANVTVKQDANASAIVISSNCPRDWNISKGLVRQAAMLNARNGASMMSDSLGSRAILNGKVYPLPSNGMTGLQLNGQKGTVKINGKDVEPLTGCDVPGGSCKGEDTLEITVPASYKGNLLIGAGDKSAVSIDSWSGGDLKVSMQGNSKLRGGELTASGKAAFNLRGAIDTTLKQVAAKVLVVNLDGNGTFVVDNGKAEVTNATVSGDGKVIMKGQFNNLKQSVQGNGSIKVN